MSIDKIFCIKAKKPERKKKKACKEFEDNF